MNIKTKLRVLLIVLAVLSVILVSIAILRAVVDEGRPILIGIAALVYLVHLSASMYFLYRFSISGQRMSSKLLVLNKFFVAANMVGVFVFLVLSIISGSFILKHIEMASSAPIQYVLILITGIYILYQENNTWNFLPTKKWMSIFGPYNKKNLNQIVGILLMYFFTGLLWLLPMFGISLPVMSFAMLFLILIQNSLAYTTFGQNRYWNFTFEFTLLLNLSMILNQYHHLLFILVLLLINGIFCYRQWIQMEYKKMSKLIGTFVTIILFSVVYFFVLPLSLNHSAFLLFFCGIYLTIFAIAFIIEKRSCNA